MNNINNTAHVQLYHAFLLRTISPVKPRATWLTHYLSLNTLRQGITQTETMYFKISYQITLNNTDIFLNNLIRLQRLRYQVHTSVAQHLSCNTRAQHFSPAFNRECNRHIHSIFNNIIILFFNIDRNHHFEFET